MVVPLREHRTPSPRKVSRRLVLALAILPCSMEPAAASSRHCRGMCCPGFRNDVGRHLKSEKHSPRPTLRPFGLRRPWGTPHSRVYYYLRRCCHLIPTGEGLRSCVWALYFLLFFAASATRNFAHSLLSAHCLWSRNRIPWSVRRRRRIGTTSGPSPFAISARAAATERGSSASPTQGSPVQNAHGGSPPAHGDSSRRIASTIN